MNVILIIIFSVLRCNSKAGKVKPHISEVVIYLRVILLLNEGILKVLEVLLPVFINVLQQSVSKESRVTFSSQTDIRASLAPDHIFVRRFVQVESNGLEAFSEVLFSASNLNDAILNMHSLLLMNQLWFSLAGMLKNVLNPVVVNARQEPVKILGVKFQLNACLRLLISSSHS